MRTVFAILTTVLAVCGVICLCNSVLSSCHFDMGYEDPCVEECREIRLLWSKEYDRLMERRLRTTTQKERDAIDVEDNEVRAEIRNATEEVYRKHGRRVPSLVGPDLSLRWK